MTNTDSKDPSPPLHISLFDTMHAQLGDALPVTYLSKATLVHFSHLLEDVVLDNEIPAVMFTGFQESSHWARETARYTALAHVARQVCVFAGGVLPPESHASEIHVRLAGEDPLRQEWFVVILSERFSTLLCGKDLLAAGVSDESLRQFETLWTFDPVLVEQVVDVLEGVIAHHRPEKLAALQDARKRFPPLSPDIDLVSKALLDLLAFEENLQRELRMQEERFQEIITAITHIIYLRESTPDHPMKTVFLSPKIEDLTGQSVEFFMQPENNWLSLIEGDEDGERLQHEARLAAHSDSTVEYRIRTRDGEMRWVRDSVHVVNKPNEGIVQHYGVIEDITGQKLAETIEAERKQLALDLEKERQVSTLKTRFMYTVSHEFRTPLATILSSSELLARYFDRIEPERRANHLEKIQHQVLHLRNLLEDITIILGEESERQQFSPTKVDIQQLTRGIVQQMREVDDGRHDITLTLSGYDSYIEADPRLLKQIISNLISNAIKYSDNGLQIIVTLDVEDVLKLRVQDFGIGIPEEDSEYLFEPFHRGSNVKAIGGTGLGLKIVKDCVELHGGTITVETQVDVGTTFMVNIPYKVIN